MSTVECQKCPTWMDADEAIWIGDKTYCEGCDPMSEELLPCPFCGGKAEIDTDYLGTYHGRCNDCGATSAQDYARKPIPELIEMATKNWNERSPKGQRQ